MVSASDHRLRVFISSTFKELVDYRQAVLVAVHGLQLEGVVMEYTGALEITKEQSSFEMVQSEAFHRLHIDQVEFGEPMMIQEPGISPTHQEHVVTLPISPKPRPGWNPFHRNQPEGQMR